MSQPASGRGYHPSSYACGCGIPWRAAYYLALVIQREVPGGTETSSVDWYACAEHIDDAHPERMLNPDLAAEGWQVLETEVHEINKEGRKI